MLLAYLWAAAWAVGPVAASWPHVFLGLMLIVPGGGALAVVHVLRDYPRTLGVVLLVAGLVLGALARENHAALAGIALPPLAAGVMLVMSGGFQPKK